MERICRTNDERIDAGQEAVARLAAGEVIGVATAYGYVALSRRAGRLKDACSHNALVALALRHPHELADFLPKCEKPVPRLLSRLSPGSAILEISDDSQQFAWDSPDSSNLFDEQWHPFVDLREISCRSIMLGSGPLADYVHPYTAWPTYLAWPLTGETSSEFQCCPTASSLAERLPNCLNYMVNTGPLRKMEGPARIKFSKQGVHVIPSSDVNETTVMEKSRAGVLFVCTGNTCRSPMAEAICRKMLADKLKCLPEEVATMGIEIASAGIAADYGHPASPEAVELLAAEGIDLSSHQSQPLTQPLLDQCERVYTLTSHHREIILAHRPELKEHIFTLGRNGQDIPDPIGGDLAVYRQCKEVIEANLQPIVREILDELDR